MANPAQPPLVNVGSLPSASALHHRNRGLRHRPESELTSTTVQNEQQPTVDPGCLPAWHSDDLPEPKPFTRRNLISMLGPGLVLAGGSIGTGELIMGPQTAARYHGALMWVALLSILSQVVLNSEVMRYTLCTGEPVMTGFLRCKPGPKFWLGFYLLLDVGGWFPTLAALGAQVIVVAWKGLSPTDTIDPEQVRLVSYLVFLFSAALVLFGGKVFNTVQIVIGGKVLFVLFYMLACTLFTVSFSTWMEVWSGLIDVTRLPRGPDGQPNIDWSLVSALAGFSGVGGLGNMMVSNFVREKGWGMGQRVGAIPSAFGGHQIALSHIGTMTRTGVENIRRFHEWFRYVKADQYLIWAFASLVGIMLPCLLGAEYLKVGELDTKDQWRWAAALAQDFGAARGDIFRVLTLITAIVILIPGQFYVVDNIARRWTDAIWSGSRAARNMDSRKIRHIYYAFVGAYVLWGLANYTFFPKLSGSSMMIIAGNVANFAIATTIYHTMYVNWRFLPTELRPSKTKQIVMALAGVFFLTMFGLVVNQKILPEILKALSG